jgi:hypothetical protein
MRPNIFVFGSYGPEDYFSLSLAYITTLFPEIGQRMVHRLLELANRPVNSFGTFTRCEFVGQEYPTGHTSSRPDLHIECSRGAIYCENKLEAPLDIGQVEEHFQFVCKTEHCALAFISNVYSDEPRLKSIGEAYLHPIGRAHYLWVDLLPAFEIQRPSADVGAAVLRDFSLALKWNGVVDRRIKGAQDSLYTPRSDAKLLTLQSLWELLSELGFALSPKPAREMTIRAYAVRRLQYPLLNPFFVATAATLDPAWDKECLAFRVLSKGDRALLDSQLRAFESDGECSFFPNGFERGGYSDHGYFVIPLHFIGDDIASEIDFRALAKPLKRMRQFLAHLRPTQAAASSSVSSASRRD